MGSQTFNNWRAFDLCSGLWREMLILGISLVLANTWQDAEWQFLVAALISDVISAQELLQEVLHEFLQVPTPLMTCV